MSDELASACERGIVIKWRGQPLILRDGIVFAVEWKGVLKGDYLNAD